MFPIHCSMESKEIEAGQGALGIPPFFLPKKKKTVSQHNQSIPTDTFGTYLGPRLEAWTLGQSEARSRAPAAIPVRAINAPTL